MCPTDDIDKFKIIDIIKNHTEFSDDTNSYKRIKENKYNLHYKSKNINLKTVITMDEFIKLTQTLNDIINFDNEITCDK